MNLYLVRHTPSTAADGLCYGQTDFPLKEGFEKDFDRIKRILPNQLIVYSSPLQRCLLLAESLFSESLRVDDRLMEMNFGQWENRPWNDLDPDVLNIWMSNFTEVAPLSGESFQQLHERVGLLLEEIQTKWESLDVNLCLVTHAGVIRSILCHLCGTPLTHAFRYAVDFGSITKVSIKSSYPVLEWHNRHW